MDVIALREVFQKARDEMIIDALFDEKGQILFFGLAKQEEAQKVFGERRRILRQNAAAQPRINGKVDDIVERGKIPIERLTGDSGFGANLGDSDLLIWLVADQTEQAFGDGIHRFPNPRIAGLAEHNVTPLPVS